MWKIKDGLLLCFKSVLILMASTGNNPGCTKKVACIEVLLNTMSCPYWWSVCGYGSVQMDNRAGYREGLSFKSQVAVAAVSFTFKFSHAGLMMCVCKKLR